MRHERDRTAQRRDEWLAFATLWLRWPVDHVLSPTPKGRLNKE
jgi:hypothetical protein